MFLSELPALAEFCNFGPSLDDMLRDRLVCGVEDPPIQRRLLAEYSQLHHGGVPSGIVVGKAIAVSIGFT